MKWVVYGTRGWIGKQVTDILHKNGEEVIAVTTRADNVHDVEKALVEHKPDRVVCLIGRTHGPGYSTIDYLEQDGKLVENLRDNMFAPFVLATLCQKHDIHLTYLGTGCIFTYDGTEHKFTEEDTPNYFGSSYSVVKGYTDRMMHMFSNVLNVRIRMPITADRSARNFITKITNYKKICSTENSMTVLPELLPIMIDMASKKLTGTVNLTNPGVISHNEVLEMYKQIIDPSFVWENFSQEEQRKILLSDRSNNHLNTLKLEEMYPNVKPIKESVRHVLQQMKVEQMKLEKREQKKKTRSMGFLLLIVSVLAHRCIASK